MRVLLITIAIICTCTGCIERTMRVTSEPAGATVFIDGDDCGKTPVDVPFTAYGKREILIQGEKGYFSRREVVALKAPVYAWFPIDFAADVLCPFTIHDTQAFHFALEPSQRPDVKALEARAEEFRLKANALLDAERSKRGLTSSSRPVGTRKPGKQPQSEP